MNRNPGMLMLLCAGACANLTSAGDFHDASYANGVVQQIAHMYYNLASNERVVTLRANDQTAGADTGLSAPIWCAQIQNACQSSGYTTSYFFVVDNPGTTSLSTNIAVLDHGDIALDTVVDCVQINWVVAHPDTDTDFDSVGDGVVGLAGEWTFWDADNGRADDQDTRLPLLSFRFDNLPGNVAAPGFLSGYTADVDLVAFGTATDLTFEIGDSDGDCNVAAFCNNNVDTDGDGIGDGVSVANIDRDNDGNLDSDLDADGLFDWSWAVRFIQPGTEDLDGDGSIDGIPAPTSADTIGVGFGFPMGAGIDNGDGTWTWDIDTTTACPGTGAEDHLAIYAPVGPNGSFVHVQDIVNGFACDGGLIADGGAGYTPPAMLQMVLYVGAVDPNPCSADLTNDEVLNFFDISLFIQRYLSGEDYNGDGVTNFFDVSAFIQDFNSGCP